MTTNRILSVGPEWALFFGRVRWLFWSRGNLGTCIRSQLGQLPQMSVEPIALAAGVRPRTLQEFLASDDWNEEQLESDVRRLIVSDHADPQAIGAIDESGHPNKGNQTAGVSRQYCGNTGKIDKCVMTVHWTSSAEQLDDWQKTNAQSRKSHTKTRHARLPRCHPP